MGSGFCKEADTVRPPAQSQLHRSPGAQADLRELFRLLAPIWIKKREIANRVRAPAFMLALSDASGRAATCPRFLILTARRPMR
jgi:hypothetical protein